MIGISTQIKGSYGGKDPAGRPASATNRAAAFAFLSCLRSLARPDLSPSNAMIVRRCGSY